MGVDGTLAKRLKDTRAQGNVHAKTGFVTGVRSIAGYLTTRDGEMLSFVIIGNNYTAPTAQANNLQDLVLRDPKRIFTPTFGNITRNRQQLNDRPVCVGDRRHD